MCFCLFLVFLLLRRRRRLRRRRHRPPMVLLCFVLDVDSFTVALFKALKQVLHNHYCFSLPICIRGSSLLSLLFLFCSSWIILSSSNIMTQQKICRTSILTIFQINLFACFFMGFPLEELPIVSLFRSFLQPACISSVLLVIHSLGHHRPSCSTKDIITSLLSLSVTVSGGIFFWSAWSFRFTNICCCCFCCYASCFACLHRSKHYCDVFELWSLFVSWELVLIQIVLSPLASSSHICNCCCCCGNFFKLPKLSPETWQCHWESCEAKKTSYQERIFHTLCEAEMIQTLWSSLWFAIW